MSSSSLAITLALSSGLMDSFSSIANVVAEATLLPSRLGGLAELSDDDSWVEFSSDAAEGKGPLRSGISPVSALGLCTKISGPAAASITAAQAWLAVTGERVLGITGMARALSAG